ncbi:hypothetical protein [Niveispirillum sp. SYP-B3756]|uniref:hypothetical protein n=1 Tax=Niveispirillum sp. SYP-B3756 TaxID=2662178 RepID=UPI00129284C7|nr:hypothetical protein [Niveispirillum sp. SYP-B3756]
MGARAKRAPVDALAACDPAPWSAPIVPPCRVRGYVRAPGAAEPPAGREAGE